MRLATDIRLKESKESHDHGDHGHHDHEPAPSASFTPAHKYHPKADFHAMDCADIIIGMARGNLSRIGDYYTRDR